MFSHILVPVDLQHVDALSKSLRVAADLAKVNSAKLTFVGVTSSAPGKTAHNPQEYEAVLAEFSAKQAADNDIVTGSHAVVSHDPSTDLDKTLLGAVDATGADLVVMASHVPGITDYVWPSHGGQLASHAKVSVMLVRD